MAFIAWDDQEQVAVASRELYQPSAWADREWSGSPEYHRQALKLLDAFRQKTTV